MVSKKVGWLGKIKNENFSARKNRSEVFKYPAAMRCHNFYSLMATLGWRVSEAGRLLQYYRLCKYIYIVFFLCWSLLTSIFSHQLVGWLAAVAIFCCICKSLATSGQAVGWLCCCFATSMRQLLNIAVNIHTHLHILVYLLWLRGNF